MADSNSKMLSQKICKCGDVIGDFMINIDFTRDRVKDEKFPPMTDFTFRNPIYSNIRNIAESCGIDTRRSESLYDEIFKSMEKMKIAKNGDEFYYGKSSTLSNIGRLKYEIRNKVKECSK